ncbi:hypothetical protein [Mycolicibacterium mageritense]|uniref:DUF2746 domain-containing protein n=1 Tax=Mycolicibacterium mageritense TaxID=53462 RepID=A0AAI8U2B5_MYCME|nr:hypothetical protein [Mycolicibacterium mageritense]BDY33143.1 hypothetical protein hbim_07118 [Mycolicibacterium mageritense]
MSWGEVDNVWGFLAVLGVAIANLVIIVVGQRRGIKRRAEDREVLTDVKDNVAVVKEEVKNDHVDDNLRVQMDRLERQNQRLLEVLEGQNSVLEEMQSRQDAQGRDIRGLRTDFGGLRGELRDQSEEHRSFVRRVIDFSRRNHPGADPL